MEMPHLLKTSILLVYSKKKTLRLYQDINASLHLIYYLFILYSDFFFRLNLLFCGFGFNVMLYIAIRFVIWFCAL